MLIPKYPMCSNFTLFLNKKVGFNIPTKRYHKNSILCGALQSGTTKWTSGVVSHNGSGGRHNSMQMTYLVQQSYSKSFVA